ncbi:hypothetical protein EDD37DRAFT_401650 [Exophiala viscosa]|uniref:CST complex subunit STN1 n=1 Tax=Exophiala viscosa TaxID=2486360 RepID=A0AAN6E0G3_9EURO|nr:hypothetical protein EDD36DRAFT_431749 [Exophiala viscosa]KAI1624152.1 hypothetical protein EDD37DRAFT_401650 [Exophiala viscosa]
MQKPDHGPRPHDIVSPSDPTHLTFYPAYSFKASETWSKWVKLTARDIHHTLKPHHKYTDITINAARHDPTDHRHRRDAAPSSSLLLFYLNHPIQFVQVVGVIVVFEQYFEKFWLFTIDDSSGATLDVTCPRPEREKKDNANAMVVNVPTKPMPQRQPAAPAEPTEEELLQKTVATLDVGVVVQAKGTLSTFRSSRQLTLLRLSVVNDTNHEMALVASRMAFLKSTLSRPWTLSESQLKKLHKEAQGEKEDENKRVSRRKMQQAQRRQREDRHARLISREYEAEEEARRKAADEAKSAGEALRSRARRIPS